MKKDSKKEILKRLKIIEGHLRRVIKMAEEDRYCIDVLQQSLAVQNALKGVDGLILNHHLHQCISQAFKKGREPKEKSIKELLKVFQLSRK
jgi:DNA-binding FrmR family transcriptional regulator